MGSLHAPSVIVPMTVILASVSLADMATGPWTDEENDLIVADYFAMLAADLAGRPYIKAEHNRRLRTRIGRSPPSIEFKHRNISAGLKGLGESWITPYQPAFNIQMSLPEDRPRVAEIRLRVPRRMRQRQEHLSATATMLANVVLHDGVPTVNPCSSRRRASRCAVASDIRPHGRDSYMEDQSAATQRPARCKSRPSACLVAERLSGW